LRQGMETGEDLTCPAVYRQVCACLGTNLWQCLY
jgi:hypothetical protein